MEIGTLVRWNEDGHAYHGDNAYIADRGVVVDPKTYAFMGGERPPYRTAVLVKWNGCDIQWDDSDLLEVIQ